MMKSKKFVNYLRSGINNDNTLFSLFLRLVISILCDFYVISISFYYSGKQTVKKMENWTRKGKRFQRQWRVRYKKMYNVYHYMRTYIYMYIYIQFPDA